MLQEQYWDRCTLFDVNFQPKNMSVEELEAGVRWLFQETYNEREFNRRKRHYMNIVKDKNRRTAAPADVDMALAPVTAA